MMFMHCEESNSFWHYILPWAPKYEKVKQAFQSEGLIKYSLHGFGVKI